MWDQMDIRAHDGALYEWEGDVLALGVFEENLARTEDDKFLHPGLAELDYVMGGVLGELVRVFPDSPASKSLNTREVYWGFRSLMLHPVLIFCN